MLYQVFRMMRDRPGMFPCENVDDIMTFLHGYGSALTHSGTQDPDFDHFGGFQEFVRRRYELPSTHANWAMIIRFHSANGAESRDTFFRLVDEFSPPARHGQQLESQTTASSRPPHQDTVARVSPSVSGTIRTFSSWLANGTVARPLLDGIDYSCIFREPSALEQVYAVFVNVLELDAAGIVLNAKQAERRAGQYIHQYVTGTLAVPPFEDWEVELN